MKKLSKDLLNKAGIYCIINVKNNKRYIGSSKNLYGRLAKHFSELRHNKHFNARLQSSWNKHTEKLFDYYILEFCDSEEKLTEKEQFYIDTMKPEYNFTLKVERNILSKESRQKQSATRKLLFQQGLLKPNHCHEIHQYDLSGNYLRSFYSIYEACRNVNLHPSTIIRCLKKQYNRGGKYMWRYEKYDHIDPYKKRTYNNKKNQ